MSNFNNKDQAITPKKAFVCSMLYAIAADGELNPQEIGNLLSVIGGENRDGGIVVGGEDPGFFKDAFEFVKRTSLHQFLERISAEDILNKQQKLFILANMLDSILGDGKLEPSEREIVIEFQDKFGISNSDFKPVYEIILFKNSKNIF
ncbi:MAG TPA: hypothetical protein VK177_14015 [Flavobacteriales bacterium]|nr:hypothetical protein [Flavobacteriales bacterium]